MEINKSTKIYIAGCGGMLGKAVYTEFSSKANVKATDIDLNEPWLSLADVRDYKQLRTSVLDFQPDAIMNLAAITDLEVCEQDPEIAWQTNSLGAENIGLLAAQLDIPCIHISTAGIFDGKQEFYNDFEIPHPLCVYAKSKFDAERYIRQSVPKHFVVRAGWMMGGGLNKDKKFINKIFKQIVAGKRELFVVDDKSGTPTYTVDFAKGILGLLKSDLYGLYNQACSGSCTRLDVAQEFVNLLGLSDKIKITVVDSSHFKEEFFATRPASEKLINMKLKARGLDVMRDWKTCLREYVPEFASALPETLSGKK